MGYNKMFYFMCLAMTLIYNNNYIYFMYHCGDLKIVKINFGNRPNVQKDIRYEMNSE